MLGERQRERGGWGGECRGRKRRDQGQTGRQTFRLTDRQGLGHGRTDTQFINRKENTRHPAE